MKMAEQTYNAMRKAIMALQMLWQLAENLSGPNTTTTGKTAPKKCSLQRTGSAGRVIQTITCAALAQCTTATRHDILVHTETWHSDTDRITKAETETHQKTKTIQVAFSHGEELVKLMQQPWEGKEFWPTKDLQGAELKEPTKAALTITEEAEPWEICDEMHIYTQTVLSQNQRQDGEW